MNQNNLKQFLKTSDICLLALGIVLALCSCSSLYTQQTPKFNDTDYPGELYYIASATVHTSDIGADKENARKQALCTLASLIKTKVSSISTSTLFDDGNHQSKSMGMFISEELTQEFENIMYLEEAYSKKHGQTTYAILNKDAWEGQKMRKTLAEKQKADAILASRYPEIPKAMEVSILKNAIDNLNFSIWGSAVEGTVDGKYGQYITLLETRRNSLLDRLLHSQFSYISEGISKSSLIEAKAFALEKLKETLCLGIYNEYYSYWIQSPQKIEAPQFHEEIEDFVEYQVEQLKEQIPLFEGKDSQEGNYQIYAMLEKNIWQQTQLDECEKIKNIVEKLLSTIDRQSSFDTTVQVFFQAEQILSQSFLGLSVGKENSSQKIPYIMLINEELADLFADADLIITPMVLENRDSIEEGKELTLSITSSNILRSMRYLPVVLSVKTSKGNVIIDKTGTFDSQSILSFTFTVPKAKETENLTCKVQLKEYPKINDEIVIKVTKTPLLNKIGNWLQQYI
jgi:hypothetical protein